MSGELVNDVQTGGYGGPLSSVDAALQEDQWLVLLRVGDEDSDDVPLLVGLAQQEFRSS